MTVLSTSLADPTGSGAIVAAARWLQAALLGSVATTVAIIAVAGIGFLMLTGRLHLRRGATVLMGCFLLFGASSVVGGLQGGIGDNVDTGRAIPAFVTFPPVPPVVASTPPPTPVPYDPYAGAAVPANR